MTRRRGPTDIHLIIHKGDLTVTLHATSLEEMLELMHTNWPTRKDSLDTCPPVSAAPRIG